MPARTGRSTFIPGRGTTTRSKSGKAKTFSGKGPAPAGTQKVAEPTAATAPTVTVSPSGSVSTSGFSSSAAASRAQARQERRQRRSQRRIKQIKREVSREERRAQAAALASVSANQRRAQESRDAPAPKLSTRTPPPTARARPAPASPKSPTPGLTPRPNPERNPAKATISSTPQFVTRPERRAARADLRQARKTLARSRTASALPGLDAEGQQVARTVLSTGKRMGASRKELLAAAETGLVESGGFHNLDYGDADSEGWRQERRMYYPNPTNVKASAKRFFEEAKTDSGPRGTAGQLAQTVQGSAFPERYDERKPEANAIVRSFLRGKADPEARRAYQIAVKKAKSLGMTVGKPPKDVVAEPSTRMVKVRADAKGAVQWAEAQVGHVEGDEKTMRWGAKYGLNPVTQPWCANFISNDLARRGIKNLPSNPNYVPSYEAEWGRYSVGTDLSRARPGDVITYSGEHIAMYVGNGQAIGGNQNDSVTKGEATSLSSHPISMIIRPPYKGGWVRVKESTSLPGTLSATGTISSSSGPAVLSTVAAPGTPTASGHARGDSRRQKSRRRKPPTRQQLYNRNKRKLKAIGAPLRTGTAASRSESHPVLEELKEKYGSAPPSSSGRRAAAVGAAR